MARSRHRTLKCAAPFFNPGIRMPSYIKNPKCPCQESNLDLQFRRLSLYPLSYRGIVRNLHFGTRVSRNISSNIDPQYYICSHKSSAIGYNAAQIQIWCARQESNLDLRLRRPPLYPLSYGRTPFILYQMQLAGIEPTLSVPETDVLSVELQLPTLGEHRNISDYPICRKACKSPTL
jgi:hypothetical protein